MCGVCSRFHEPFLNAKGRKACRDALLAVYDDLVSCEGNYDDGGRIKRIGQCIVNTISDIETLIAGKGEPA
jgi:hypothetical protein